MPTPQRAIARLEGERWVVVFPHLPGCRAEGESLDEADANAVEAVQVWLDDGDATIDLIVEPRSASSG